MFFSLSQYDEPTNDLIIFTLLKTVSPSFTFAICVALACSASGESLNKRLTKTTQYFLNACCNPIYVCVLTQYLRCLERGEKWLYKCMDF